MSKKVSVKVRVKVSADVSKKVTVDDQKGRNQKGSERESERRCE